MAWKSLSELARELKVSKSTVGRWADLTRGVHEPLYDEAGERWFSEEAVEHIRQRRTHLFNAKGEYVTMKALEKSEPKLIENKPTPEKHVCKPSEFVWWPERKEFFCPVCHPREEA